MTSAITWTVLSVGIVFGIRRFNALPDAQRRRVTVSLETFANDVASKQSIMYAVMTYFVLKFLYHVGILGTLELAAFALLMHYCYRQATRFQRTQIHAMQMALRNPSAAAAVLGPQIPSWVSFPSVEKTQWFNTMVREMWPNMSIALEGTTDAWIQWYLDYYKPGFLSSLKVSKCKLGPTPMDFTGVEIHNNTPNETILDFHMQWNAADSDIRITAGMGPLDLEVIICDLQMECILRVIFGPYINQWPCFAAMSYSFVGKPRIDFQLKAAKMSLDAIPGLSQWLDNFLRDTLSWCMVYPKRIVTPMIAGFDKTSLGASADPIGYLKLTVEGCQKLPKNMFLAPQAVVDASVTGLLNESYRATADHATSNPDFNECFKLQIYDKSATLRLAVSNTRNPGGDDFIGELTMSVEPIIEGREIKSQAMALSRPSEPEAGDIGTITFSATFCAYSKPTAAPPPDGSSPPRVNVAPRGSGASASGVSNTSVDRAAPAVPRSRPGAAPAIQNATVFIHLVSCSNLKNVESVGKSDPYVVFKIGAKSCRSTTMPNTLDPVWWKDFKLESTAASTDVLNITVWDEERVGSDRPIGKVDVPLQSVLKSNGRIKQSWPLSPQGSILMELKILAHS